MSACLLCLSCLSVCLSVVYVYLFVCPSSTCLSVCLSSTYLSCLVCLSDGLNALSVCESDCPLACCLDLSVSRLSVDQSVCRSVCLSVSLTVGRSVCRPVGVSAGYLLRYSLSPNLSRLLSLSHILAQSLTFIHSHQLIRSNCREQAISLRWSLSQTHWESVAADAEAKGSTHWGRRAGPIAEAWGGPVLLATGTRWLRCRAAGPAMLAAPLRQAMSTWDWCSA